MGQELRADLRGAGGRGRSAPRGRAVEPSFDARLPDDLPEGAYHYSLFVGERQSDSGTFHVIEATDPEPPSVYGGVLCAGGHWRGPTGQRYDASELGCERMRVAAGCRHAAAPASWGLSALALGLLV